MSPREIDSAIAHYEALLRAAENARDTAYNADIVARVEAEADAATRLPWWWPEAAVVVFVATLLISVLWPLGWAS